MQQLLRPPGQRVATAQPLAALPLTDAACPLRASGTRGRRNQWNTGDGNTGSAAARDSKKRSKSNASLHPDDLGTIRHGTAVPTSQKTIACPKVRPNRSRHRYVDPRARGGPLHRSAPNAFLFGPCTARFSFGTTKEKWGVHPAGQAPPGGSQTSEAAVRRPIPFQGVPNAIQLRCSLRPSR